MCECSSLMYGSGSVLFFVEVTSCNLVITEEIKSL